MIKYTYYEPEDNKKSVFSVSPPIEFFRTRCGHGRKRMSWYGKSIQVVYGSCIVQPWTLKWWEPTAKEQRIYEGMVRDTRNAWIECVQSRRRGR